MKKTSKIVYVEPDDYFPESLRKKYKLGEYAEPEKEPPTDEEENKENSNREREKLKMAEKTYDHGKGALKPIIKPRLKEDPKTGKVIQPEKKSKQK